MPGVPETPEATRGLFRGTIGMQYQLDPLVASEEEVEFGAVIHHRVGGWFAAELHPTGKVALGLALPLAGQWGSEVGFLSGDGFGVGDPVFSVTVAALRKEASDVHARVALAAPVGAKERWLGDSGVRADLSLGGRVGQKVRAGWALGGRVRDASGAEAYLGLGSELWGRFGLTTRTGPVEPIAAVAVRAGLRGVIDGSPTFAIEPVVGLGIPLSDTLQATVVGGRGITAGYGATDARVRAHLTWRPEPRPPRPPPPQFEVVEIDDPPPAVETFLAAEPPPPPAPPPPALPRIAQTVRFPVDTAELGPEAIRMVDEVAALLFVNKAIDHVVIEGRASDEGDHGYNWLLSASRARAVFQALVARGVHPDRLSWRAMGEVRHTGAAAPDDRLVTFEVTRMTPTPVERPAVPRPWDGKEGR